MRRRLIALAVAGVLVLALPGAAVGFTPKVPPEIISVTCTIHVAENWTGTYIYYDANAGKPQEFTAWSGATTWGPFKIPSGELKKAGVIALGVFGQYASMNVSIANHYGEDGLGPTTCSP